MSQPIELASLIRHVGRFYDFTNLEMNLALDAGQKSIPQALMSYRAVAKCLDIPRDDRVTCNDCLNRSSNGVCRKAESMGDKADYRPTPDTPRNCEEFKGKPWGAM